jgi:hypothetical protein
LDALVAALVLVLLWLSLVLVLVRLSLVLVLARALVLELDVAQKELYRHQPQALELLEACVPLLALAKVPRQVHWQNWRIWLDQITRSEQGMFGKAFQSDGSCDPRCSTRSGRNRQSGNNGSGKQPLSLVCWVSTLLGLARTACPW